MENFDLEPPHTCITGQDSLVTSHYVMCWIIRDLILAVSRVRILFQKVQINCRVHITSYSIGTGLCLELNRAVINVRFIMC